MSDATLSRRDLTLGSIIAVVMAIVFASIGGLPLVATFIPGVVATWCVFLWMQQRQIALPEGPALYPLYFGVLAWQFIHFSEEFMTGFRVRFPALFGAGPFSIDLFLGINMFSYAAFTMAFILVFVARLRFLLVPALFFAIYGALGNAVSHTYWVIWTRGYFPGFFTAQLYWILGPWLLARLTGSWRPALVATGGFAVLLLTILSLTMKAG